MTRKVMILHILYVNETRLHSILIKFIVSYDLLFNWIDKSTQPIQIQFYDILYTCNMKYSFITSITSTCTKYRNTFVAWVVFFGKFPLPLILYKSLLEFLWSRISNRASSKTTTNMISPLRDCATRWLSLGPAERERWRVKLGLFPCTCTCKLTHSNLQRRNFHETC